MMLHNNSFGECTWAKLFGKHNGKSCIKLLFSNKYEGIEEQNYGVLFIFDLYIF